MDNVVIPPQRLSYKAKNKSWRKKHIDWAKARTFDTYEPVRNSVIHKKVNYDLLNGKLHREDMQKTLNPEGFKSNTIPTSLQYYPIMNTKIELLLGEEAARPFEYRVVCTDPNAVTDVERAKSDAVKQRLQSWVQNTTQSEEEAQAELENISDYFTYEYQDMRELRANQLVRHYETELNFSQIFNDGFLDACAVSEEIYQCDIEGGEPTLKRLNPMNVRVFMSGYSNKIEDADMIIIEDYWSPGKIYDAYYDVLSEKDRQYIDDIPNKVAGGTDSIGATDFRYGFINKQYVDNTTDFFVGPDNAFSSSLLPYDTAGNIRVLKVYWKSKRKIKRVKSYDAETGEEVFTLHTEEYIIDKNKGEEEETFWVNEAWEGTLIGDDVYVNMQRRPVQYNRLSNPSRCHFGIIGTIYNINDSKPFSLVDRMKPLVYLYTIYHDRLNKVLANNWGNMVRLDFAKMPKGWKVDQWIYYAKNFGLLVEDSFNQGTEGTAKGKIAGGLNNASAGVVNATDTTSIQYYTMLLDYIRMEIGDIVGINKQREGQIANRETVGGVERATLQSSHITEWLFSKHTSLKKRVYEAFIETAKIALVGRSKKFESILSDGTKQLVNIDGDSFAENDYGVCCSDSNMVKQFNENLNTLAQAALQNDKLSFGTLMKIYSSASRAEKQRFIENDEKKREQQRQQEMQQQNELKQQELQQRAEAIQQQYDFQDKINQRDNETRIKVAEINGQAEERRYAIMSDDTYTAKDKAELAEKIREFNAKMKQQDKELAFKKQKHKEELASKNNTDNK